jgi:hypothetical protein
MTPYVGAIVLYVPNDYLAGGRDPVAGKPVPAIVTEVFNAERQELMLSVLDARHVIPVRSASFVLPDPTATACNTWHWPKRPASAERDR